MVFTRESLWALRKEIVLNSLFIADYRNSLHIDPHMLCNFFDGFLEEVEMQMEEEIPGFNDAKFWLEATLQLRLSACLRHSRPPVGLLQRH